MSTEKGIVKRESPLFKPITRKQATYLLRTVWPDAPDADVIKAAIICTQYNLNPLLKHVALIKFEGKKGTSWVPVLAIKAKRIIAQRRHTYSFVDGPRVMTDQEQEDIYGEVDLNNIRAICVLEEKGMRFPGYGAWPKNDKPHGEDKGNTKHNMAFIRAESNATEKMAPGELPSDIEVADETYLPPVNIKAEITAGKTEFIEETEKEIEELWPNEKSKNPRDPTTIKTIEQLARALKEDYGLTYQQQWAELNIGNWSELTTTPAEAYRKVAAART